MKDKQLTLVPIAVICFVYLVFTIVTTLIMDKNPLTPYSSYNLSLHYIVQSTLIVLGTAYLSFVYLLPAWRSRSASVILENAGKTLFFLQIVLFFVVVLYVLIKYTNCAQGLFCNAGASALSRLGDSLYLALFGYPILFWPIGVACTLSSVLLFREARRVRKKATVVS